MFKTVKAAIVTAMIATGAVAAVPATASADPVVKVGGSVHFTGSGFGIYFGEGGHRYHDRWERPRHMRRYCSPRRAVRKARRIGLRHARIAHVNHRTIGVKGRRHGHREYVVFARAPHCPILRY